MTASSLSPGAADALLFDLGRVVINIDFSKALACWAAHAGCTPAEIAARFVRNEAYKRHETGEIPGIGPLLARAAKHLPLYAFSNTNRPHVAHFSPLYADTLAHFKTVFAS